MMLDRLLRWFGLDFDLELDREAFHRITAQLYLGTRPGPADVDELKNAGITHVVSCLPAGERDAVAFLAPEFHTRFLAIHDGIHEDLTPTFEGFFDTLSALGPDDRLLVHCQVGVSRSATLAIAHVMTSMNQRFYEAFCEVRSRRPQILPNIGFASQLQRLEDAQHPPRTEGLSSLARYLHEVCKVPVEASVLQAALEDHDFDALRAIRSIFGGDVPRVIQGMRTG